MRFSVPNVDNLDKENYMRCVKYLMIVVLALSSVGCQENVKMEDFNAVVGRVNQLERDVLDFKGQQAEQEEKVEALEKASNSQEKQISSQSEQLNQVAKQVEGESVKLDSELKRMSNVIESEKASRVKIEGNVSQALAADQASRQAMEDRFSEAIYERGLAMAQFRRILTEFLSMEKDMAGKIVATQGTFNTETWNGKINKIVEALESLKIED